MRSGLGCRCVAGPLRRSSSRQNGRKGAYRSRNRVCRGDRARDGARGRRVGVKVSGAGRRRGGLVVGPGQARRRIRERHPDFAAAMRPGAAAQGCIVPPFIRDARIVEHESNVWGDSRTAMRAGAMCDECHGAPAPATCQRRNSFDTVQIRVMPADRSRSRAGGFPPR